VLVAQVWMAVEYEYALRHESPGTEFDAELSRVMRKPRRALHQRTRDDRYYGATHTALLLIFTPGHSAAFARAVAQATHRDEPVEDSGPFRPHECATGSLPCFDLPCTLRFPHKIRG
jgi:hypothetical protein